MQDELLIPEDQKTRLQLLVKGSAIAVTSVVAPQFFAAENAIKMAYLANRTGSFAQFIKAKNFMRDRLTKALTVGLEKLPEDTADLSIAEIGLGMLGVAKNAIDPMRHYSPLNMHRLWINRKEALCFEHFVLPIDFVQSRHSAATAE